jgi:hypothetical protein
METEEKMMTGEESLRIISEMINKTKVNVRQSSFHLLFWGWLIFGCSISEYLLWKLTDFASPWYVWIFVVPGIFVSIIYGFTTGKKARVHTYADYLYMWTWLGFMIAAIVLFIMLYDKMELFAPFILLLAGFPTFISGVILKFRPLMIGGSIFWIMALGVTFASPSIAPIGMPVAVIAGYLIPGYMLRKKVDNETL